MTYNQKALKKYQSVNVTSSIENAKPHQLVLMLLNGALTAVARAKGLMEQKNYEGKGEQISKASQILISLKAALDHEKGGEIASNLDNLYDYCIRRLVEANRDMDTAALDEVNKLVGEIRDGWQEMAVDQ